MASTLIESFEQLIVKSYKLDSNQESFAHYLSIKDWYKKSLNNKFSHFSEHKIAKRGLINGLGSMIKFITGNADAYDVDYFEKTIEQLKINQKTFVKQAKESFSANYEFNEQLAQKIKVLRENQIVVAQKINQILSSSKNNADHIKIQMQETIDLLQILHNSVSEIEISFSFCKANILHPSIIPKKDLDISLHSLRKNFPEERIPPTDSNYYDTLGTTSCLTQDSIILFGIQIPLFSPLEYRYEYLATAPVFSHNTYGLIAIDAKYALRQNETILGLPSKCTSLVDKFYCKRSFKPIYLDCIKNILLYKNTSKCTIVPVKKQNSLTQLNENEYVLGFLPIKIKAIQACPRKKIEIILQGTFLFTLNECILTVGNETLRRLESHSSKLTIINGDFNFPELVPTSPLTIQEITDLDLNKTNRIALQRLREFENINLLETDPLFNKYHVSVIGLFIIAVTITIWFIKKKYTHNICADENAVELETQNSPPQVIVTKPFNLGFYPVDLSPYKVKFQE